MKDRSSCSNETSRARPPRLLPVSVPFAVLGLVLEEKSEGGEAKQEGLEDPEAARGPVVDALVTAATRRETQRVGASNTRSALNYWSNPPPPH